MWMTIRNIWQQAPQGIYEIKVCAWIQICRREGTGGMRDEDRAESIFVRRFAKVCFDDFSDV